MDTITTRCAGGANVGVKVGDGVSVSVAVAVAVSVNVGDGVAVGVCVAVCVAVGVELDSPKGSPAATGIWQASRITNEETDRSNLRVGCDFMDGFLYGQPIT